MVITPAFSEPTPDSLSQLTPRQQAILFLILNGADETVVGDAGIDFDGFAGTTLQLDASRSFQSFGDPLQFAWTVVSQPTDSDIEIVDADTATPGINPVVPGAYAFAVTVSDAEGNQSEDIV